MNKKYSPELRQKVLEDFKRKVGEPFSPARIRDRGGVELFKEHTGKTMGIGGIINFLLVCKDPDTQRKKQAAYNKKMYHNDNSSNPLYSSISDKKYILVPSHGEAASFDTVDEVKIAIEQCQSVNLPIIKFKLLEVRQVKVQTVVSCEIE